MDDAGPDVRGPALLRTVPERGDDRFAVCARYYTEIRLHWWTGGMHIALEPFDDWAHYNIAPTDTAPVVRAGPSPQHPRADLMRWGLVPYWAKDLKIGARMINARSEEAATKPAFREAFRRRRCLVPASGFFEWTGGKGNKQPHVIRRPGGEPFTLAGLWESWNSPGGDTVETFTILTCDPNDAVTPLHDRMPVILPAEHRTAWLSRETPAPDLHAMLEPYAGDLETFRVSPEMNRPGTSEARFVDPID